MSSVRVETREGNAKVRNNKSEVLFLCFWMMNEEHLL
jgi:hypothetical protein